MCSRFYGVEGQEFFGVFFPQVKFNKSWKKFSRLALLRVDKSGGFSSSASKNLKAER